MIPAILFDLDDTLFDHHGCTRDALDTLRQRHAGLGAKALADLEREHGAWLERLHLEVLAGRLSVDEARRRRFAGLCAWAGEPVPDEEADRVAAEYREAYRSGWRLVPGALALLDDLRAAGAPIGIVTNNVVEEQVRKVEALGLAPRVDALVISEAVGVSKPDARIFQLACERVGRAPGDCVMVGDAWANDVAGARGAGLHAVWFNPGGAAPPAAGLVPELRSLQPADAAAAVILGARYPGGEGERA